MASEEQYGLFVEERDDGMKSFHVIGKKYMVIGRDRECDIRIINRSVSKMHGVLLVEGGQVKIQQKGMVPMTLNGTELQEGLYYSLSSNDVLEFPLYNKKVRRLIFEAPEPVHSTLPPSRAPLGALDTNTSMAPTGPEKAVEQGSPGSGDDDDDMPLFSLSVKKNRHSTVHEGHPVLMPNVEETVHEDHPLMMPNVEEAVQEDHPLMMPNVEEAAQEDHPLTVPCIEEPAQGGHPMTVSTAEEAVQEEDCPVMAPNEEAIHENDLLTVPNEKEPVQGEDCPSVAPSIAPLQKDRPLTVPHVEGGVEADATPERTVGVPVGSAPEPEMQVQEERPAQQAPPNIVPDQAAVVVATASSPVTPVAEPQQRVAAPPSVTHSHGKLRSVLKKSSASMVDTPTFYTPGPRGQAARAFRASHRSSMGIIPPRTRNSRGAKLLAASAAASTPEGVAVDVTPAPAAGGRPPSGRVPASPTVVVDANSTPAMRNWAYRQGQMVPTPSSTAKKKVRFAEGIQHNTPAANQSSSPLPVVDFSRVAGRLLQIATTPSPSGPTESEAVQPTALFTPSREVQQLVDKLDAACGTTPAPPTQLSTGGQRAREIARGAVRQSKMMEAQLHRTAANALALKKRLTKSKSAVKKERAKRVALEELLRKFENAEAERQAIKRVEAATSPVKGAVADAACGSPLLKANKGCGSSPVITREAASCVTPSPKRVFVSIAAGTTPPPPPVDAACETSRITLAEVGIATTPPPSPPPLRDTATATTPPAVLQDTGCAMTPVPPKFYTDAAVQLRVPVAAVGVSTSPSPVAIDAACAMTPPPPSPTLVSCGISTSPPPAAVDVECAMTPPPPSPTLVSCGVSTSPPPAADVACAMTPPPPSPTLVTCGVATSPVAQPQLRTLAVGPSPTTAMESVERVASLGEVERVAWRDNALAGAEERDGAPCVATAAEGDRDEAVNEGISLENTGASPCSTEKAASAGLHDIDNGGEESIMEPAPEVVVPVVAPTATPTSLPRRHSNVSISSVPSARGRRSAIMMAALQQQQGRPPAPNTAPRPTASVKSNTFKTPRSSRGARMLQQVGLAGPSTPAGARKGDRSEVVAGAAMKAAVVYVTAADLNSAIKSVAAVKKCVGKGVVSEEIEEVVVGQQCAASPCEDGTIAEERECRKLREAEEESEAVAETKGYDKQAQHRQEEVEEDESKPAAEETLGDDNQAQHQMEEGDVVVEEESEPVVEETLGDDKQAQQQQDEVEEDESEPVAEEEGRQEQEVSREKAAEDGMSPEGGGSVERNLLSKRSESEATEQAEPSQEPPVKRPRGRPRKGGSPPQARSSNVASAAKSTRGRGRPRRTPVNEAETDSATPSAPTSEEGPRGKGRQGARPKRTAKKADKSEAPMRRSSRLRSS